jgi:hypothetical protein
MTKEGTSAKKNSRTNWFMLLLNGVAVLSLLLAYAAAAFTPETMGYFSLFGLAYPFSLLANLVFIFYWYFKKRRFALISLSFIMLGVNHLTAFFQISTSGSVDQDAHQIKVLTYNVHVFDVFDKKEGAATRDAIYDLLHREQADVVCFQEFYQSEKSKSYPTRDTLIEFLPSKYYHERYTHAISDCAQRLCSLCNRRKQFLYLYRHCERRRHHSRLQCASSIDSFQEGGL